MNEFSFNTIEVRYIDGKSGKMLCCSLHINAFLEPKDVEKYCHKLKRLIEGKRFDELKDLERSL